MGRGIISAERHRTERIELATLESDPSAPDHGEAWLRIDLTDTDKYGEFRWYDGSIRSVDVIAPGSAEEAIEEVLRVQTPSGLGVIPTLERAEAAHPEMTLQHGGQPLGMGIPSAIPDSVRNQYLVADFTADVWSDSEGPSDIDTITGLTKDDTSFGGTGGVFGDGVDDNGQSDTMGSFLSSIKTGFAVVVPFTTTDDDGTLFGAANDVGDSFFWIDVGRLNSGQIEANIRGNDRNFQSATVSATVNDGSDYVCIIQSETGEAEDIEIYFDATTDRAVVDIDQGPLGEMSDYDVPVAYFARNNQGSIDRHIQAGMNKIRWFSNTLTESERSTVFNDYNWYDPSTDAP